MSAGVKNRRIVVIGALRDINVSSVYAVTIFMKYVQVCVAQTAYQLFTKLYIKPDFPS